jgi:hypothetical protein
MPSLLEAATSFDALLRLSDPRLPYRFDRIFSGEGFFARRLSKQRFALLRRLDGELQRMLESGEKVEYLSWGIEYSFVEAYFLGLWHTLLNRRAVVLTNRRILLLQVSSRRRLLDLKSHVRYEAVQGFTKGALGVLALRLRNGQRVTLTGMPRRDRKALRARIGEYLADPGNALRAGGASGRQNLCPHCYATVTGFPERCPRCAGGFKSGARAGWLSLVLPGLGDWYLGHRALGTIELAGALALWALLLPGLGASVAEQADDTARWITLAVGAAILFSVAHVPDAWITRRTGRKGLYPAKS